MREREESRRSRGRMKKREEIRKGEKEWHREGERDIGKQRNTDKDQLGQRPKGMNYLLDPPEGGQYNLIFGHRIPRVGSSLICVYHTGFVANQDNSDKNFACLASSCLTKEET